jgi:hypothetical protein
MALDRLDHGLGIAQRSEQTPGLAQGLDQIVVVCGIEAGPRQKQNRPRTPHGATALVDALVNGGAALSELGPSHLQLLAQQAHHFGADRSTELEREARDSLWTVTAGHSEFPIERLALQLPQLGLQAKSLG